MYARKLKPWSPSGDQLDVVRYLKLKSFLSAAMPGMMHIKVVRSKIPKSWLMFWVIILQMGIGCCFFPGVGNKFLPSVLRGGPPNFSQEASVGLAQCAAVSPVVLVATGQLPSRKDGASTRPMFPQVAPPTAPTSSRSPRSPSSFGECRVRTVDMADAGKSG